MNLETIRSEEGLALLAERGWDELVRSMPRPSPFLVHAWLLEWWRHFGKGAELQVHVADREGRLVGALPLFVRRRAGVRVGEFIGGGDSALADLLLAPGERLDVAAELTRLAAKGLQLVDLFGLPAESRLEAALGHRIRLIERVEAPVLDLSSGWEEFWARQPGDKRRDVRRRRRRLAELGRLEVKVARDARDLEGVLGEAFRLHELRWRGRPDSSRFATSEGQAFVRAALGALVGDEVPRIVTLELDGRAIAFYCYFAFCGTMIAYRQAFDPAFAPYSPGFLNTLDAIESAAGEGLRRVEFLGGGEPYKLELADRIEPLYEAVGLARGPGRLIGPARLAAIGIRLRAKRSRLLNRLYYRLPRHASSTAS